MLEQIDKLASQLQLLRDQVGLLAGQPDMATKPTLLCPEEAAVELGVGRSTIYRLMESGDLRRVHIGKCTRISRADLDRYLGGGSTIDEALAGAGARPRILLRRRDAPRDIWAATLLR